MFLFPSGLMLGAHFTVMDYLFWNEIPTVLGNLVGGLSFTGLTLYATHVRTRARRRLRFICYKSRRLKTRSVRLDASDSDIARPALRQGRKESTRTSTAPASRPSHC